MLYIQPKEIDRLLKGILIILIASPLFSAIYCMQVFATNNQILINKVELNPADTDSSTEKIELYNPSGGGIDVSSWTTSIPFWSTTQSMIPQKES